MTVRFEDFELDPQRFELRRGGARVPMEPQVFDVLALLVANRDRVVTKEELMDAVWGDRFISEAALNSRVMSARKAIGDTGREQRLIRTVHGRGYRFVGEVAESSNGHAQGRTVSRVAGTATAGRPPPARPAAPSLLGRETELARLAGWFAQARSGRRTVGLISGEAGAGKTTLLQAFLSSLDAEAVSIAHGQCLDHRGEGEPYLPVLEALTRLCFSEGGDAALGELRRLAPSWLVQMPSLVPAEEIAAIQAKTVGAGRERMLREIAECLDGIASIRPLVLVIEDLHWSDRSTLDVLSMIARRPDAAPLLVLGTYRPADASASRNELPALVRELTLRGYAQDLALGMLPPSAVQEYVQARAGAGVPAEVAEMLARRTGGHPLYMTMVYEAWQAEGILGDPDALAASLQGPLPANIGAYIDQRFSLLSEEQRAVLEAASVVGREFSAAAIAPALGMRVEGVERVCESLARAGLFIAGNGDEEWPDGTVSEAYAFMHDLYAEVLYAGIPAARASRLHQQVGGALEAGARGREQERATELAYHFSRGRVAEKAVTYLRMAGEQALQRAAGQEAAGHLAAALEFVPRLPEGPERDREETILRLELASALIPSRGMADQESEELYLRAVALAEKLEDEGLTSIALFGLATMYEVRGEYERSAELMNRRLVLEGRPHSSAPIESLDLLACSEFHRGMYEESLTHARDGIALYQSGVSSSIAGLGENPAVGCHDWAALSLLLMGDPAESEALVRKGIEIARRPENEYSLALAHGQAAVYYQLRGQPREALDHAQASIVSGRQYGHLSQVAWSGVIEAWARAVTGDCDAVHDLEENMRRSLEAGARMDHNYYLGLLADARRVCGDIELGLAAVEEALASQGDRAFFYEPELRRLKAVLLVEREGAAAADEAARLLEQAMNAAEGHGSATFRLRSAIAYARLEEQYRPGQRKARELLGEIVRSFEEGLDFPDLQEARALLGA